MDRGKILSAHAKAHEAVLCVQAAAAPAAAEGVGWWEQQAGLTEEAVTTQTEARPALWSLALSFTNRSPCKDSEGGVA